MLGTTTDTNLYTGCLHDHRVKDRPGWSVRQTPDGRVEWTTPTGHRYSSDPHDYRPDNDPNPPLLRHPPAREPVPEDLPETAGRRSVPATGDSHENTIPGHDTGAETSHGTQPNVNEDTGSGQVTEPGKRSRTQRWRTRKTGGAIFGPPGTTPSSPSEDDSADPPPF